MRTFCLLLLVTFSSVLSSSCLGQANAVDAALNGYVGDASKAVIPNAKAVLTNVNTGISQSAMTDGNGYYRFPLVPVGEYRLTVTASGFKTTTQQGVSLVVGQEGRVDVALAAGGASETVEVQAAANLADSGTSTIGAVLSQQEIENIPIASRNLFNVLLLSPGVIGNPTSTFSTTQFLFGGTERAQWNLDGLDNTQHGSSRQIRIVIVTPESVAETQTLASGYSAEFGRAAGGQVNAILKSGTNALHGSGLGQYRPIDLQAIPTLLHTQPADRTWYDYAFTLGGPIVKDRLFFFGQYENNPYTLPNAIAITPANAALLNLPTSEIGSAPFGETYRTLVGKVTYTLGAKNSGYVRYSRFTNHQPNNDAGLGIVDRGSRFLDHQNSGGVQLATVISSRILNEFRAGVSQRDTANLPVVNSSSAGSVLININGAANIGFSPLTINTTTERESSIVDNLTITRGRSTFKVGAEFDHELFANVAATAPTFTFNGLKAQNGRAAVSSVNQYLNTVNGVIDPATGNRYTYDSLTSFSGNPEIRLAFNFINFFAQDEIRFNQNLSANVGLRYEAILFPTFDPLAPYPASRSIQNNYTNIAPRIAFNYSPRANRKTVIHAAYGMYYDVPPLSVFYNAAQVNGHRLLNYLVSGTTPGAPTFPTVPSFVGLTGFQVKPSITAFDQNFQNAYQHQVNLQLQQELGFGMQLTTGYQFSAYKHGLYFADANLTQTNQPLADGRPAFTGTANRPNPAFGAINVIRSGASTNFNGAFLTLQKRLSAGYEFTANYTYSHALSDNVGEGTVISDPTNIHRDYGNADGDIRHNFVFQAIARPTFHDRTVKCINGFELSTTTFVNSGFPINPIAGIDLNNDGVFNDRPLFVSRNALRGNGLHQADIELKRYFDYHDRYHLSAFVIAENIANSNNLNCNTTTGCTGAVVNAINSSSFLRETSARTARNIQVGLNFQF